MKQRIITAIIAAALFLPIVFIGGLPLTIATYIIASVGLHELLKMRKQSVLSIPGVISLLLLWIFLLPSEYEAILNDMFYTKVELALLAVLLFLTYTVATKNRFTFEDVAFATMSTFYVGLGFYFFIETRDAGIEYVFYALFIIFATDSGAYFIGRAFGKRKLWPEISPKKTIEGSIGGVICAVITAVVFSLILDSFWGETIDPITDSVISLIIVTIILSIFGQIGDLVESALKRYYNVKDSGNILPGHGGVLDRFDSLLFVLPLLHFLQITP